MSKKNNLSEVDEAIFEGVEMQCEIIFYTHAIRKGDLDDVA
jgi:hypothetical protein